MTRAPIHRQRATPAAVVVAAVEADSQDQSTLQLAAPEVVLEAAKQIALVIHERLKAVRLCL